MGLRLGCGGGKKRAEETHQKQQQTTAGTEKRTKRKEGQLEDRPLVRNALQLRTVIRALGGRSSTDIEKIGVGVLITASGLIVLAHESRKIEGCAISCGSFAGGRAR